jgi:HlyD family type I secretion membrane fusion protein
MIMKSSLGLMDRIEQLWQALLGRLPGALSAAERAFLRASEGEPRDSVALIKTRFHAIESATFEPRRFGFAVIGAFFVAGGLWSAVAPLSSAAIAPGLVSPKSSRQTVQHLEGGIIRDLMVHEGDHVVAGQTLITLEDIGARAEAQSLRSRYNQLMATEARLSAEREGMPEIDFPRALLAQLADPNARQIVDTQVNQFNTRKANDNSRKAILRQRMAELDQQISGLREQLTAAVRQSELIDEEAASVKTLVDKGLERKPRLLALQRNQAELLGQAGDLKAKIAQAQEAIGETQLEIMKTDTERTEDVAAQLADTQAKSSETYQALKEREDRLARTAITAPVTGIVLDLRFKTPGGVVKPGESVIDIVPTEDVLVIDARISPKDIDQVHGGLKAQVMFPSYAQRTLPRLDGRVTQVSADTLTDERTGERYYTARVEVDRRRIHELAPNIELQPGMPADVFIATGERTVLEYLLGPFFNVLNKSFRES